MAGMNPIMAPLMWGGESVPWRRCAARCGDGRMDNWEMEKWKMGDGGVYGSSYLGADVLRSVAVPHHGEALHQDHGGDEEAGEHEDVPACTGGMRYGGGCAVHGRGGLLGIGLRDRGDEEKHAQVPGRGSVGAYGDVLVLPR